MQLFLLKKCISPNFQNTDIDIKLAATTLPDHRCINLVLYSHSVTNRIQHPLRQLETWQPRSTPHLLQRTHTIYTKSLTLHNAHLSCRKTTSTATMSNAPTLFNLPPPPSDPVTPSDVP
jgi:hypothetical protein